MAEVSQGGAAAVSSPESQKEGFGDRFRAEPGGDASLRGKKVWAGSRGTVHWPPPFEGRGVKELWTF